MDLSQRTQEQAAASMEQMTATVKQNTDSSMQAKQLPDIISFIDGIAFQTNLLALNAAERQLMLAIMIEALQSTQVKPCKVSMLQLRR